MTKREVVTPEWFYEEAKQWEGTPLWFQKEKSKKHGFPPPRHPGNLQAGVHSI